MLGRVAQRGGLPVKLKPHPPPMRAKPIRAPAEGAGLGNGQGWERPSLSRRCSRAELHGVYWTALRMTLAGW